jgi:hypothetical protein
VPHRQGRAAGNDNRHRHEPRHLHGSFEKCAAKIDAIRALEVVSRGVV